MRTEASNLLTQIPREDSFLRLGQHHDIDGYLVHEAMNGSDAAFGELFDRYRQRMFRIANRILRNREDAEDAVQQAFKHTFLHLSAFQGDSQFSTWLTRITINEALQMLRRRRAGHTSLEGHISEEGKPQTLEIEDANATPEERCNERELHGILNEAIGELRPIFRKVVQMYEIDEFTSEKTAQVLGLTSSTVKARAFRARRMLRRKLSVRLGIGKARAGEVLFAAPRNCHRHMRKGRTTASPD